jgi:hypothetical protein
MRRYGKRYQVDRMDRHSSIITLIMVIPIPRSRIGKCRKVDSYDIGSLNNNRKMPSHPGHFVSDRRKWHSLLSVEMQKTSMTLQ